MPAPPRIRPISWPCVAELGPEAELPEDAVVVRGGLMDRDLTISNAHDEFKESGIYGLSVWSVPELDAADIIRLARSHGSIYLPHAKFRQSTIGRLRPYALHQDIPEGHYLLKLPTPPADSDWDALERAFDSPEASPRKEEE